MNLMNEHDQVVTENLAKGFVDHRSIGLRAKAVTNFGFIIAESAFDVRPLVVGVQKTLRASTERSRTCRTTFCFSSQQLRTSDIRKLCAAVASNGSSSFPSLESFPRISTAVITFVLTSQHDVHLHRFMSQRHVLKPEESQTKSTSTTRRGRADLSIMSVRIGVSTAFPRAQARN